MNSYKSLFLLFNHSLIRRLRRAEQPLLAAVGRCWPLPTATRRLFLCSAQQPHQPSAGRGDFPPPRAASPQFVGLWYRKQATW